METEKTKNKLILATLALALLVQVFNAASLYASFSNLNDVMKFAGSAFIGISAEVGIFTCIYAGSKQAGRFFAVLSFLVGILFHNEFTNLESIDFWTTKNFISSSLMQLINSSLVWFLSEWYVKRTEDQQAEDKVKNLKQELAELSEKVVRHKQTLAVESSIVSEMIDKKEQLQQDIKTLQKQKAGMSALKIQL